MAASYLTIGSQFQPYSYDELVKPLVNYQTEYNRQEELYNQYADNAALIGELLDPQKDAPLYNQYQEYMSNLNDAASDLASNGLTPNGRNTLNQLRRRFTREFSPIKNAYDARAEARKLYNEGLIKDPSLLSKFNPNMASISDYMNGNIPDQFQVSGTDLYNRGVAQGAAASKRKYNIPKQEALALQGQYFRILQQSGFSQEDAAAFIQDPTKIAVLHDALTHIEGSSGISNLGTADQQRARQRIIEGIVAGMSGTESLEYKQNRQWDLDHAPVKGRTGGGSPKQPKGLSTYDVEMGHYGDGSQFSDDEKFINTLRLNSNTITNPELDRLMEDYADDFKVLKEFEDKYGTYEERDYTPSNISSLSTPGMRDLSSTMNSSTTRRKGFSKNGKFTDLSSIENAEEYRKARERLYPRVGKGGYAHMQEIQDRIGQMSEKYGYIPGTDILDSIQKGIALDIAQATQERTGFVPDVKPVDQKNKIDSIISAVGVSVGGERNNNRGLRDAKTGKLLSKKDRDAILTDKDLNRYRIISTVDEPVAIYDQKTESIYVPVGIKQIDNYRSDYSTLNGYLKDYSNSDEGIADKNSELSELDLRWLSQYGTIPSQRRGHDLGNGYEGFISYTVDERGKPDVVKYIIQRDARGIGHVLAVSSLNDEISGGGRRGDFMKSSSQGFLYKIFNDDDIINDNGNTNE